MSDLVEYRIDWHRTQGWNLRAADGKLIRHYREITLLCPARLLPNGPEKGWLACTGQLEDLGDRAVIHDGPPAASIS